MDTFKESDVQDADWMNAIGAISIARAFAYGGRHRRAIYVPSEESRAGMDAKVYRNNTGISVNHFYEKLILLRDMMNTDMAKHMASVRHDYIAEFLDEFIAGWNRHRRSFQYEVVPPESNDPVALHLAEI